MTEYEYDEKVKQIKVFCIIIAIITVITGILGNILSAIIDLVVLYCFYTFSKKRSIAGPIIGIVLAVLYISQMKLIPIIMGIVILIACIPMVKYIQGLNKQD